jgi:hypothetical protein
MKRRVTASVALGAAAAFVASGSLTGVHAAAYPADKDAVVIKGGSTDVEVGDEVQIEAKTFDENSDVTIEVSDPLGATAPLRGGSSVVVAASGECETGSSCVRVADGEGVVTASVSLTQAGEQTVTATGVDPAGDELVVSATFDVAGDASGDDPAEDEPSGGLAATGTDLLTYGAIGIGLIAMGALVVTTVRRRNQTS